MKEKQELEAREATGKELLIFSPLIVWRLSRPSTARWFKMVTTAEARARHGGTWVWFITLWAIAGGVLQTIAAMR